MSCAAVKATKLLSPGNMSRKRKDSANRATILSFFKSHRRSSYLQSNPCNAKNGTVLHTSTGRELGKYQLVSRRTSTPSLLAPYKNTSVKKKGYSKRKASILPMRNNSSTPSLPKNPIKRVIASNTPTPSTKIHLRDSCKSLHDSHMRQTYDYLRKIKHFPPLPEYLLFENAKTLTKPPGYLAKKTLVFDLDETLVHCSDNLHAPCHTILKISLSYNRTLTVSVNIRPFALEALRKLSKLYEIIIFTASHQAYADAVLDLIDPNKEYIHHRLYRQDCIFVHGFFIKDLRILQNRELAEIIIVDNAVYSFCYQLDNGIPIVSWYDNLYDTELLSLIDYLTVLSRVPDVRTSLSKKYQLSSFMKELT